MGMSCRKPPSCNLDLPLILYPRPNGDEIKLETTSNYLYLMRPIFWFGSKSFSNRKFIDSNKPYIIALRSQQDQRLWSQIIDSDPIEEFNLSEMKNIITKFRMVGYNEQSPNSLRR